MHVVLKQKPIPKAHRMQAGEFSIATSSWGALVSAGDDLWETEQEAAARDERNRRKRVAWDQITEQMIAKG